MKYQGRDGKYYTIQKVSVGLTGFLSLFIAGFFNKVFDYDGNSKTLIFWLALWTLTFLIHYIWFLKQKTSTFRVHYKEYRLCLALFLALILASILIYAF